MEDMAMMSNWILRPTETIEEMMFDLDKTAPSSWTAYSGF